MDRLSDLPKNIVHNILSRMTGRDVVRTSILSKAWNHTWSTFLILNFSQYMYEKELQDRGQLEWKIDNFNVHVEETLSRFRDQGLPIREFKLDMDLSNALNIYPCLDYWLKVPVESGVQVLELILNSRTEDNGCDGDGDDDDHYINYYCLPQNILEAISLSKLILEGYLELDFAFQNFPIQFSSLQELSLINVRMNDERIIEDIISSCPFIEYLRLELVPIKKYVRIHGLPQLKKFVALNIYEIVVDAPNLEEFRYVRAIPFDIPFETILDNSINLRVLDLSYLRPIIITDQWLLEHFTKFPLLEILKLHHCLFSEIIKVSSISLKVLEISDCVDDNLKEVIIDAVNLCSLKISFMFIKEIPTLTFLNDSSLSQIDATIYLQNNVLDFQKLREFLQDFQDRGVQVCLCLCLSDLLWNQQKEFNLDAFRDISVAPPRVKELNLKISSCDVPASHLVTGLLWSCSYYDTISMDLNNELSSEVIQILGSVLSGSDQRGQCCCSSGIIKCWWHDMKNYVIAGSEERVRPEAFPHLEEPKVIYYHLEYELSG